MRKRKAALLAAVVLAGTMLLSCTAKTAKKADDIKPPPPFTALTDVVGGRKDIYLITKNLESSYWQVIVDGAEAGGKDLDCNVFYSGSYVESDWEGQERLIDDAVSGGADAIILAPDDSVMLAPKLEEIYSAGIPIVLIDTTANTDSYDLCYMTDNLMAGQQAAQEMIRQLEGKGHSESESLKVGIQVGATTSQTINERLAGFCQFWTQNAPPSWEIVSDIKTNEGNLELAKKCAEELLDENPDLCGVFGSNNGSTVGFAKVIKERARTDVVVIGFDYSEDMAALLESDEYTASTMLQRQYDMSYRGIASALEILDGRHPSVKFIDTGVMIVNHDNLDDPDVREVLEHS